jgi:polysaccharide deacetylase family protein (PEP-CTERM system associated)
MSRSRGSTDLAETAPTSGLRLRPAAATTRVSNAPVASPRTNVLTIALEDYYHATPFRPWIREDTWYRFEDRLAESTRRALDLLERCGARATFFVDSRTARSAPALVREVAGRGHEIASRGDHRGPPRELGPERFRQEAIRCREQLEEVVGRPVLGFRLGSDWLTPHDLWVLDVLAECGYLYDSSIGPALGINAANVLQSYHRHRAQLSHRLFQEVPISSLAVFGLEVPVAPGSLRHFPTAWMRSAVEHWHRHHSEPYVMYFRMWELDPEQPRISAGPLAARIWHYRNLDQMPALLESFLTTYRFTTVATHLGLEFDRLRSPVSGARSCQQTGPILPGIPDPPRAEAQSDSAGPKPVTIVVPCFNESQSLRYLSNTLKSLTDTFRGDYAFTFVFVDDGSTDDTWSMLQQLFSPRADCRLVRHERNRGVAHSIQTGIRHAETQVVCSIDCDCTYDPHELGRMIPLLTDGVDLVTASPYHPEGRVRNVPSWRLFLSKTLSRLYSLVLHQKLYTYTSCFRVYRRQSAAMLEVRHPGFLGVAELVIQADVAGRRIIEYPTTLDARVLGRSKMKILWTIAGHLSLLAELVRLRLSRRKGPLGAEARS